MCAVIYSEKVMGKQDNCILIKTTTCGTSPINSNNIFSGNPPQLSLMVRSRGLGDSKDGDIPWQSWASYCLICHPHTNITSKVILVLIGFWGEGATTF